MPRFAAIDLGTNNCRLMVAERAGDGFRVVEAYSRIVRLGEGVATTGRLAEAAVDRAIEALRICAGKIHRLGVAHAWHVATEACRRASNCDEFLDRVEAETGIRLEIISTEQEARLALAGCVTLIDPSREYAMVFDIGGGSTELVWARIIPGQAPEMVAWTSVPLGVVTFAEQFGSAELDRTIYAAMVRMVREQLAPFDQVHRASDAFEAGRADMIGISGTITTLVAVQLGLSRYDRSQVDGRTVSLSEVREVSNRIMGMTLSERAEHPCILPGRADLVLPGCAVLEAVLSIWPSTKLRVADRGLREGMLREMMGADLTITRLAQ